MNTFRDFLTVLRPLWFISLFQILFGVTIIIMPQGQDMMLNMIEDFLSKEYWSFLYLIIALYFWSITSEFGSRFLLYISDISSHHLAPVRVQKRKHIQRNFTRYVLFLPLLFTTIGFVKVFSINFRSKANYIMAFGIIMAILGLVTLTLYLIYINHGKLRKRFYVLRFMPETRRNAISALAKLTGILQDKVVISHQLVQQGEEIICKETKTLVKPDPKLFQPLFNRFWILFSIAITIVLLFCIAPFPFFSHVGALAILSLAFGCWITVYFALELLDKTQPFLVKLPWKAVVLFWIILVSIINHDHRITEHKEKNTTLLERLTVEQHFERWVTAHEIDTTKTFSPVFVVAEGGALRTGAFASILLSVLADSLDSAKIPARARIQERIYAFSSVSGGTIGANFFHTMLYHDTTTKFSEHSQDFFSHDFLSATTGTLVFGEIVNMVIPVKIEALDRAYALEKSWEQALSQSTENNILGLPFEKVVSDKSPALFIHSTEVETGRRSIFSNVKIDSEFVHAVDLYAGISKPIPYSAALGVSARFPLLSPAAAVVINNCKVMHYVDGGYYENLGATTTREIILRLRKRFGCNFSPRVLVLSFGETSIPQGGYNTLDDITSIVSGIYNTRSAHTTHSNLMLREVLSKDDFIQIDLSATTRQVPLNWILSQKAVDNIENICRNEIKKRPKLVTWFH